MKCTLLQKAFHKHDPLNEFILKIKDEHEMLFFVGYETQMRHKYSL